MTHVSTSDLAEQLGEDDEHYLEVLSEESVRVELAEFPNPEPKTPHKEDELYFVISGSGMVHVGGETHAVEEGDIVYVEQGMEHDFFDIEDTMTVLVVFTGAQENVLGRPS